MQTTVLELYVHGPKSSLPEDAEPTPMILMESVRAVENMGLAEDERYFHRGDPGRERKRQVSLIDEGTIWRLEKRFGSIQRAHVKSQVILAGGLHLPDFVGQYLVFEGGPVLKLSLARKPCFAMDFIEPGMREAMENGEQGALATVIRSGVLEIGQPVVLQATLEEQAPLLR